MLGGGPHCTAYVSNIIENPQDPKFRRVNLTNKAFVARVASCGDHGVNFLTLCGFKPGGRAEYIPEGKDPAGFIVCQSTEEGGDFNGASAHVTMHSPTSLPFDRILVHGVWNEVLIRRARAEEWIPTLKAARTELTKSIENPFWL